VLSHNIDSSPTKERGLPQTKSYCAYQDGTVNCGFWDDEDVVILPGRSGIGA
jgi:hypothetical protein